MYGVFPIAVPQFGDAIDQPGQHTKRYRRVLDIPCETRTCLINFPPDVEIYSLQDALLFNDTALSFIVNCPPGRTCPPGTYPKTITYPRGTFVIPDPNDNPGFPIFIQLRGCQSNVYRLLDAGSTQAQINAAAQEVIQEVARQQAECDALDEEDPNPQPPFFNQIVTAILDCADCEVLVATVPLPYYITMEEGSNELMMRAGMIAGSTQDIANQQAQAFLDQFAAVNQANGNLDCTSCLITTASPLPDGEVGVAYSEALAASDVVGAPVWTVSAGALPDGLSINSATGEISGTPTTEETANFTVTITSGEQCCSKDFEIDVEPLSNCADWSTLLWGTPAIIQNGAATGSFTPQASTSDSFSGAMTCPPVALSEVYISVPAGQEAVLTYNGPGCNCNLHLEITGDVIALSPWSFLIGDAIGGIGSLLSAASGPLGIGIHDLPFSLPDTLGADLEINVVILGSIDFDTFAQSGTQDVSGTISNV